MSIPLTRLTLLAVVMLALGSFAVAPRRNVWGDPGSEREIARCRLADASLIRLYRGEPGATVQNWYSVTHTPSRLGVERQIIFSYSAPEFTQLFCTPRGVALSGPDENSAVFLATSEASSLRWLPRRYERGSARGAERQNRISVGQVEGVVLLLIGIALLVAQSRQHRAHMAATQRALQESGDPNCSLAFVNSPAAALSLQADTHSERTAARSEPR